MELSKIPKQVLDAVRQREKFSDAEIGVMTPRELFEEYCNWHGIIRWSDTLMDTVLALQAAEASGQPALQPADGRAKDLLRDQMRRTIEAQDECARLRALLAAEKPKVAVWLEDGVVQGAVADKPVEVVVIDYNDLSDEDERFLVPKADGSEAEAVGSSWDAEVDPGRTAEVFQAVEDRRPAAGMKP